MKDNLPFFSHDNNARNHPKMKALIAEYGYEGYGRFWALNERIAESAGAFINISRKVNKLDLAKELGLDGESLNKFLVFLSDPEIDLINIKDDKITTDRLTECFSTVNKERERRRKPQNAEMTVQNAEMTVHFDTDEMKEDEMRSNEIKEDDDDTKNHQSSVNFKNIKKTANSLGFFLNKKQANAFHCLNPTWLQGSYNFLVFAAEKIKQDRVDSEKSHSEWERIFAAGWKCEWWLDEYPIWRENKLKSEVVRSLDKIRITPPEKCPHCNADTGEKQECPECKSIIIYCDDKKTWIAENLSNNLPLSDALKTIARLNNEPDF